MKSRLEERPACKSRKANGQRSVGKGLSQSTMGLRLRLATRWWWWCL